MVFLGLFPIFIHFPLSFSLINIPVVVHTSTVPSLPSPPAEKRTFRILHVLYPAPSMAPFHLNCIIGCFPLFQYFNNPSIRTLMHTTLHQVINKSKHSG
ncbi:hypothetical protein BKA61DRAFT_595168 [Leptodontidium sp. MPI-SDFR-AT-0119]|nr:hypothetical protein BKA61DRAFT_595168 [Leptodontidium sp. MPI-SDFR-AT-0119]